MTLPVTAHFYLTASHQHATLCRGSHSSVCTFQTPCAREAWAGLPGPLLGSGLQSRREDAGLVPWSRANRRQCGNGGLGIRGAGPGLGGPGAPDLSGPQQLADQTLHKPLEWAEPAEEGLGRGAALPWGPVPGSELCPLPHCPEPRTTCSGKAGTGCCPPFSDGKTGLRGCPDLRSPRARPSRPVGHCRPGLTGNACLLRCPRVSEMPWDWVSDCPFPPHPPLLPASAPGSGGRGRQSHLPSLVTASCTCSSVSG